jgi:pimeloyl-ACP methyl ester carboxylesterase
MGGEVTTALAELQPERIERLILIDGPAIGGGTFTMLTEAYLLPVLGELLSRLPGDRALRRGLAQGFAPGFAVPEKFVADIKQLTYIAFRMAHNASVAYRTQKSPNERLAMLKPVPPLLAIHGVLDAIVAPEQDQLFRRVSGGKVAIIEGAGHSPMVERPAQTLELIRDFLAQSESPP